MISWFSTPNYINLMRKYWGMQLCAKLSNDLGICQSQQLLTTEAWWLESKSVGKSFCAMWFFVKFFITYHIFIHKLGSNCPNSVIIRRMYHVTEKFKEILNCVKWKMILPRGHFLHLCCLLRLHSPSNNPNRIYKIILLSDHQSPSGHVLTVTVVNSTSNERAHPKHPMSIP